MRGPDRFVESGGDDGRHPIIDVLQRPDEATSGALAAREEDASPRGGKRAMVSRDVALERRAPRRISSTHQDPPAEAAASSAGEPSSS